MKSLKPLVALTLLACAVLPCRLAQAADSSSHDSAVATKLKQMETAWGDSMLQKDHGASVITGMVADDFAGVTSKGKMQSKSSMLDEMKTEDTLTSSTTDSMQVHMYGNNVATVCGTSTEKGKDKAGKAFTHRYGWVDTWMQRNGKWQCIAESGALLPNKK
jgi:ketosteroid isomerase-like protein